ncbi:MAG: hypothetical protein ACMG5Z_04185 [Luteimonas sp.]
MHLKFKNSIWTKFWCLVLSAGLACCSQKPTPEPGDQITIIWKRLSDGSYYGWWEEVGLHRSVYRCWPTAGVFDCLSASDGGSLDGYKRFQTKQLFVDPMKMQSKEAAGGYGCLREHSNVTEHYEIPLMHVYLLNKIGGDQSRAPWRGDFVEKFARENNGQTHSYFDCLRLLELVNSGGVDLLGTTLADRAKLIPVRAQTSSNDELAGDAEQTADNRQAHEFANADEALDRAALNGTQGARKKPNSSASSAWLPPRIPFYDTAAFCRNFADRDDGSAVTEKTCREHETRARSAIASMSISPRTMNICNRMGKHDGGGSYETFKTCVEHENEAAESL